MKRKLVFAVVAALLVATGLWLARSSRHSENSSDKPTTAYFQTPESQAAESDPGQTNNAHPQHRPPNQAQRFLDFTPEQRVQQARKGHGPGG